MSVLKETAAEIAALIPRYSWEIMDETQRDDLMARVILPNYMHETADGVTLGPSWWAETVGATMHAISQRVYRLQESQKPSEEASSRALSGAERHAKAVMRDPEQAAKVLAQLPPETVDEIARAANTELNERAKTDRGVTPVRLPVPIPRREKGLYHTLLDAVTAIDALTAVIDSGPDYTSVIVEPTALASAERGARKMGEAYAAIREATNERLYREGEVS